MKIISIIIIAIVALLSIAAGMAKVMLVPQELEFLSSFGFSSGVVIAYGIVQVVGGVLVAIPRTVRWGAIISLLAFSVSSVLLFTSSVNMFAFVSLLPIVLSAIIYWKLSQLKAE